MLDEQARHGESQCLVVDHEQRRSNIEEMLWHAYRAGQHHDESAVVSMAQCIDVKPRCVVRGCTTVVEQPDGRIVSLTGAEPVATELIVLVCDDHADGLLRSAMLSRPPIRRKMCETCGITPLWRTDGAVEWTAECLGCMQERLWPGIRSRGNSH